MSHNESYLNTEAIRHKEGIEKSGDNRVKWERIMMESNRVESKERESKKIRGVYNSWS